ncbi:membrane-associated protein, putative [Bodo saltans]|uniref:Membrane-associated protein, putative n=1 Tax=Bodo saltans TaxID=75058 RepID=A0A0S4JNJ4_BODSA|nr:membrane-associated protein, putative [Bodo saltans]|eukprot:CUG90085.1 membrane-associated protein, putative [Bodo saltans]
MMRISSVLVIWMLCPAFLLSELIPCSSVTLTTTVLQSNTNYFIEDCFVPDLPPSAGGGFTPILHPFTGYLSPSHLTLTNVSITVRNSNVVPTVHMESIIPGLPGVAVNNIYVALIGVQATWPVGLAPAVVDSVLSVREIPFVNVSLELRSCVLNFSLPSTNAWILPVFAWFRPPVRLDLTQYGESSQVTIIITDSHIYTFCDNRVRSDLFVFEVPGNDTITNVLVDIVNSSLSFRAIVWRMYPVAVINIVGRDDCVAGIGSTTNTSISNVVIRVCNSSDLTAIGILPIDIGPPQFPIVTAALFYVRASRCSHVYVVIADIRSEVALVRSLLLPSLSPVTYTNTKLTAALVHLDIVTSLSHVTFHCSNTVAALTSVSKAYVLLAGSFVFATLTVHDVNITVANIYVRAIIVSGNSGESGKEAICIGFDSFGTVGNIMINIEHSTLRTAAAVDGGPQSVAAAVLLNSASSHVQIRVVGVILDASTNPGTISFVGVSGATVALFIAVSSIVIVNGNAQNFSVYVYNSRLHFQSLFNCPIGTLLRFTSTAAEIVFIPGIITTAVVDVKGCDILLVNLSGGFGGTPALLISAGGSWDANFVGVVGTVTQKIAYAGLPTVVLPLVGALSPTSGVTSSIFDSVHITILNTSISASINNTGSSNATSTVSTANLMISILSLYATTMRNTASVLISDSTAFLARGGVSTNAWKTCQRPLIITPGGSTASVVAISGTTIFESGTRISVARVAGVVGPLICGYSLVPNPAKLTLEPNTSISFAYVSSSGTEDESSVFGLASASTASSIFTVVVVADSTLQSPYGIDLSFSSLCGFGYLAGPSSSVSSTMPATLTLLCNTWSPTPLAELLTLSETRLSALLVKTPSPGSDWDASCPAVSMTVTDTPAMIMVPQQRLPVSVKAASSVLVGGAIWFGSLLGGTVGGVHGIQAAMLLLRVQLLCEESDSPSTTGSVMTPVDLCCDLSTSPTQLTTPGYAGVYVGGVFGNTIVIVGSTGLRYFVGQLLQRADVSSNKPPLWWGRIVHRLRSLAPPSGPVTLSWTAYMFLLCPTVSLCVALASDETLPSSARWLGGVMLPLWLVPWTGAFFGLCWCGAAFAFRSVTKETKPHGTKRHVAFTSAAARSRHLFSLPTIRETHDWLLEAQEELVPRRGSKLRSLAKEQLRRFGSVFAGYRAARYWCFNVEVGFAIATGAATGLMLRQMGSTDPCAGSGWAWAVVGVGVVETTAAVVLRAFALRLELAVFVAVMVFTILSEIVALLNPNAVAEANALSIVAAVLQILSMLYSAFEHFRLRHRTNGEQLRPLQAVGTAFQQPEPKSDYLNAHALRSLSSGGLSTSTFLSATLLRTTVAKRSTVSVESSLESLVSLICEAQDGTRR